MPCMHPLGCGLASASPLLSSRLDWRLAFLWPDRRVIAGICGVQHRQQLHAAVFNRTFGRELELGRRQLPLEAALVQQQIALLDLLLEQRHLPQWPSLSHFRELCSQLAYGRQRAESFFIY